MRRNFLLMIVCSLICLGAYRWGDTKWENAKETAIEYMYIETNQLMLPYLHAHETDKKAMVYKDIEHMFLPILACFQETEYEAVVKEDELGQDKESQADSLGHLTEQENVTEQENMTEQGSVTEHGSVTNSGEDSQPTVGDADYVAVAPATEKKVVINRVKLQEFDYLRQTFYQIDNTTTIGSDQLNVDKLLGKSMKIASEVEGPQVLIYHTHSQEGYVDSIPGDANTSVVAVGDYLELLLEEKYGIDVLHHKGQYDVEKRDSAYSNALPDLQNILKENPTIEVVIDLHRDGVPADRHLVTEINGKATAQIMFFNGLSRTTARGALDYLANPYIEDNLAMSFQLQLAAAEYYPGLTRRIYLKGYRYNMHLCPKSILVEVGAQTNTFAEAKNAMEPLSDILAKVLLENTP